MYVSSTKIKKVKIVKQVQFFLDGRGGGWVGGGMKGPAVLNFANILLLSFLFSPQSLYSGSEHSLKSCGNELQLETLAKVLRKWVSVVLNCSYFKTISYLH